MRIMTTAQRLTLLLLATGAALLHPAEDRERGDAPGWVMIDRKSVV